MTRLERKNREDIDYKMGRSTEGRSYGMFDLFDDSIKSFWRINDSEYDYIAETATDDELDLFVGQLNTIGKKRKALKVINSYIIKHGTNNNKRTE